MPTHNRPSVPYNDIPPKTLQLYSNYIISPTKLLFTLSNSLSLSLPCLVFVTDFSRDMADQEPAIKVEPEATSEPAPSPHPLATEHLEQPPKDVTEEKSVIPPPPPEHKRDDSKALAVVEKAPEYAEQKNTEGSIEQKNTEGSINRDAVLARVATEKKISLIKAWEESEKSKAENKAHKKLSAIGAWENSRKASIEAELKKIEEQLEKKKAEYVEKMKNKVAMIHKAAEEKRAVTEAKRGEDLLKAEEMAAKYQATGTGPKKFLGCFSA
ncbi:remorin-like [Juglans microcarpa x Juglans regia]|uniref:remorin-like n=1 Tax=Juglans microcarpa x Juglans regia TaxID=2249226 RepID=UPI001B7E0258|nr:remorin-like [Juglans microcarpa x Juglans regia]